MTLVGRSVALGAFLVVVSAIPAAAHAETVNLVPSACSIVDSVEEVRIDFSDELAIEGSRLEIFSDGRLVASAGPDLGDLDRASMVASLPPGMAGVVEVEWTSASVLDDDAASGRYAFSVGGTIEGVDCEADEADGESSGATSLSVILGLTAVAGIGVAGIARRSVSEEV